MDHNVAGLVDQNVSGLIEQNVSGLVDPNVAGLVECRGSLLKGFPQREIVLNFWV